MPNTLEIPSGLIPPTSDDKRCPRSQPLIGDNTSRFENWIIDKESKGNPKAHNPGSSAFGLGQLLKSTREEIGKILGINPDTINPSEQLAMFRYYISNRYGNHGHLPYYVAIENAYNHWINNGWY